MSLIRRLALAAALLLPSVAWGQSSPQVYQSRLMTSPHDLAKITRNGQISDAGGLLGDASGRGVNPFAVQDNLGLGECFNSAATGGQYNAFCFGHDANGDALITLDSYGGLANKGANARINGVTYPFPFIGPGSGVLGPNSTSVGDFALFNNTGGTLLKNAPAQGVAPLSAVAVYSAKGDGSTDNTTAFTNIFANTNGDAIYLPAGTYLINTCGQSFQAASGINIWGAGKGKTIIQLKAGCTLNSAGTFAWLSKSGGGMHNLTLDLNNNVNPGAPGLSVIYANAYTASVTGFTVDNVQVINGVGSIFLVGVGANNGFVFTQPVITNNYLVLTTPNTVNNQCIGLTTVNAGGRITGFNVSNNVCVNTAIQIDGDNGTASFNDVSGWKFGTGIFVAFDASGGPSAYNDTFVGNVLHDTTTGTDINNTAFSGVESTCYNCLWSSNIVHDVGGGGFENFGDSTRYIGNLAYNYGTNGSGGAGGVADESAFGVLAGGAVHGTSQGLVYSANSGFGGTYGFVVADANVGTPAVDGSNHIGSINLTNTGIVLPGYNLFTQTAGNFLGTASSIAFTNLDTISYKTWHMVCRNLSPATASRKLAFQIGTVSGGITTWVTGANYVTVANESLSGALTNTVVSPTTGTYIQFGSGGNWDNTQSFSGFITMDWGELNPGSGISRFQYRASYDNTTASNEAETYGSGWYNTSPGGSVASVRVVDPAGGNVYGVCTLEGRPS